MALADGVISYWKLDEVSGTRFDTVGSNNLTDINNVGFETGQITIPAAGNAASFVRANAEQLDGPAIGSLDFGDEDFTIAGWVKLSSLPVEAAIFMKWNIDDSSRSYGLEYSQGLDRYVFFV